MSRYIFFIVLDSVRADRLPPNNAERSVTPFLDSFRKECWTFNKAFAQSNYTFASVPSMMTGQYPSTTKVLLPSQKFPSNFNTIPKILQEAGFSTLGFSIDHLIYSKGVISGFDQFYQISEDKGTAEAVQKILEIMGNTRKQKDYFFYLHTFDPHRFYLDRIFRYRHWNRKLFNYWSLNLPNQNLTWKDWIFNKLGLGSSCKMKIKFNYDYLVSPTDSETQLPKSYLMDYFLSDLEYGGDISFAPEPLHKLIWKGKVNLKKEDFDHLVNLYDQGIAYCDYHIGRLVEGLKKLGKYDSSYFIITSDHGEALAEERPTLQNLELRDSEELKMKGVYMDVPKAFRTTPYFTHNNTLYDDQIHVPLIIKYPGIKKEKVIDDMVRLIDVSPTLFELLGLELIEPIDGVSLINIIDDEKSGLKALAESYNWRWMSSLRTENVKLIHNLDAGNFEQYNLMQDPDEKNCIDSADPTLREELRGFEERMLNSIDSLKISKPEDKVKERLKQLGYLD